MEFRMTEVDKPLSSGTEEENYDETSRQQATQDILLTAVQSYGNGKKRRKL
jgi:hypothetical protein